MDKDDVQKKIKIDEDYIKAPKFSNSLTKFLEKFDGGVKNNIIAKVLLITEEEVEKIYEEAVEKIKKLMKDGE